MVLHRQRLRGLFVNRDSDVIAVADAHLATRIGCFLSYSERCCPLSRPVASIVESHCGRGQG